jgi:hypothetical protein
MWVPFSLHPCQYLLLVVFLMIAVLRRVTWNLSVVVLFSSVTHFFMGSLIWGEFSFLSCLYILVISPWPDL